jgi:NADH dehydrogenase
VTGAFGYTGRYITRRLLRIGRRVKTLTGHPDRPNPFGSDIEITRFDFDNPERLARSLRGAETFYNTYWIRFPRGALTFDKAVENGRTLIRAATQAGVRRFVHISITNPSEDSPLEYFSGKAVLERVLADSSLSYAVVRPTVVFGREDILINNIAWLVRRFPVFVVPGSGEYRLQPIFVEDLAELAVNAGHENDSRVFDAVGPEIFTFNELVRQIGKALHCRTRLVHVPPIVAVWVANLIGRFLGDVPLTREEARGLMANLLVSNEPPTGRTRLSEWLETNSDALGRTYASELARHYR